MATHTDLTVLIYLKAGQEDTFRSYEARALPHLARHGGHIEYRFTPGAVSGDLDLPDQVHVLSFETKEQE